MNEVDRLTALRSWLDSRTVGQRAVVATTVLASVIWLFFVVVSTIVSPMSLFFNILMATMVVGLPYITIVGIAVGISWVLRGK